MVEHVGYYITILADGKPVGLIQNNEAGRKQLNRYNGLAGITTRLATIDDKKRFRADLAKRDRKALEDSEL